MSKSLEEIEVKMDLERTDQLFSSAIKSAGALEGQRYTEDSLKQMRAVMGAGNLHINSAKVKLGAIRLMGYVAGVRATSNAVSRKVRDAVRRKSQN